MGHHRLLEHTADIGVELEADSLPELLRQAALSFPDLVDLERADPQVRRRLRLSAESVEELLISWYNELVYLLEQHLATVDAVIVSCSETDLSAEVTCVLIDPDHRLREIKAATWHQLEVVRTAGGWRAHIYLDM